MPLGRVECCVPYQRAKVCKYWKNCLRCYHSPNAVDNKLQNIMDGWGSSPPILTFSLALAFFLVLLYSLSMSRLLSHSLPIFFSLSPAALVRFVGTHSTSLMPIISDTIQSIRVSIQTSSKHNIDSITCQIACQYERTMSNIICSSFTLSAINSTIVPMCIWDFFFGCFRDFRVLFVFVGWQSTFLLTIGESPLVTPKHVDLCF